MSSTRLIVLMIAVETLAVLPTLCFPALIPQFSALWSLSAADAGWIMGAMFIAYMLSVPFLVPLTDRYDSKHLVAAGTALIALSNFGFALTAAGFWSACFWRFLCGIGIATFYMPGLRALTDRVEPQSKGRAITWYVGAYSVGSGLSLAIAGWLEALFGWQAAFVATSVPTLLGTAMTIYLVPGRKPPASTGPRRHPLDFRPLFRNRRAVVYILSAGTHSFEFSIMRNWMTAYMAFALAWHGVPALAGLSAPSIAALSTLMVLPASVLGGVVARRIGARAMIFWAIGISFVVASLGGVAASLSVWAAAAFVLGHTFTVSLDQGVFSGATIDSAKPEDVGLVMTGLTTINWLGVATAPVAAGIVFDLLGGPTQPSVWGWGYFMAGAAPLLGAAMLRFWLPRVERAERGA